MKRNLFSKVFMTMTATAVMGLASCSNDNDPAGGQELPQGKATGMQLVLDLGGTATRVIKDDNADVTETTIENLNIFIYGANGVFEKEHKIAFGDLTDAGDNKYKTKELVATTGAKTIYVGANMTQGMIGIMRSTSVNGLSGKGVNQLVADITQDNKFVMFSTTGATPTLVEDNEANGVPADNQVAVSIQRLAAKIAVGMTANLADANVQLGAAGTIDNLGYVVDNINKMYYLTYGGAVTKDANMTVDQYKEADFEIKDYYDQQNPTTPTILQYGVITPGTADKTAWAIDYASENLTQDKMMKGVTRIVVKGTFTPESGYKVEQDAQNPGKHTFTLTNAHIAANATYHLLDFPEAGGYAFFDNATTDDQLKEFMALKKGVDVTAVDDAMLKAAKKTYINGLNYWWVTVKDNQGDVLRNHYYQVNVTSIWAPGRTDGKFDPDKDDNQIDKETNITVEVTVEPWNLVPFNADLRP
ncbi:major fimbrial subunit family protein [Bacteroides fragilis str. S38L5]|uniref:Mfa1 family fimbria major subunit n=1 Tax=Bacteroides fragilis TaxID=817 RepID=UPI00044B0BC8|nr:Mfa1 family fimbria major subunit [Bacteroides fragilis]EYA95305.1 major fimbrial subunit family protein [Bacteroides fragilis str. S38L5]EYB13842.1 major fimbrial subunit family protein [Bacteroides fragilis str. S38L3]MCE9296315.1 Mfa1 family fimbria major subunit [Bacteroides fragilis]MCE9313033.1 Mfa1 family fimbria major subunit [Bacteroides fragilis]MCS3292587.1 Mfa1 family fimbria major subunit [Bacteroides fragilis]